MTGIEPATSTLARLRSYLLSYTHTRADDRDRTGITCLEGRGSTIELRRHELRAPETVTVGTRLHLLAREGREAGRGLYSARRGNTSPASRQSSPPPGG